jgi:Ydr279p family RNase H2 complex subunit/RNase H subunit-like protein
MARTRASKPSAKDAEAIASASVETKSLPPRDEIPTKVFILPKDASQDARIVTLPDPGTGQMSRYYFCPKKGIYEFTKIAAPNADPRSWLLTNGTESTQGNENYKPESKKRKISSSRTAYLSQSQDLFVATPVDSIFFLLSLLVPASQAKEGQKSMFITFEDHIGNINNPAPQLKSLLETQSCRTVFERRMPAICDVFEAGEDSMYKISYPKLASTLLRKAIGTAAKGLPSSMEERFVTRALQTPLVCIKREDSALTESVTMASQETETSEMQNLGKQQLPTPAPSKSSQTVVTSSTSTSIEIKDESIPSDSIKQLLRTRVSLDFTLRSYIPSHLHEGIRIEISKSNQVDFTPLDEHLQHLEKLRAEAQALRTISDNISRKRANEDDDEAAEARAEKKRKKDEEERKKKSESRAIKDLKKADTSGMKKLSSFFTKAAPKKT